MVVCVVGLGSMGKRRIRLLQERNDVEIIGIESNEQRREDVARLHGILCFESIDAAMEYKRADAAFVCTSPLSHAKVISECLNYGLHIFTEINLVADGYCENMQLAKEKDVHLFLSSTFLYRPETQYITEKVKQCNCPLNYNYHVGQYLPDWHPWESYQNFFVGEPRTNGCREIFAIELPWIVTCFGPITEVKVQKRKLTALNINYNDSYQVLITHENGSQGTFNVDVVSRKAVRKFEVYGEELYLTWNGTPDSMVEYDYENKKDVKIPVGEFEHLDNYAAFITENPYRDEITNFINLINGSDSSSKWSFEKDQSILKVIDEIED